MVKKISLKRGLNLHTGLEPRTARSVGQYLSPSSLPGLLKRCKFKLTKYVISFEQLGAGQLKL